MRIIRSEKGQALAIVLMTLLFGSLVIGGLLGYLVTSVRASGTTQVEIDAYYAAEAGVEVVLADLVANGDDGFVPGPYAWSGGSINGYNPSISVVDLGSVSPEPRWTTFSNDYLITSVAGGATIICQAQYAESLWGSFVIVISWEHS